jgi:hypothetical protein
MNGRLLGFISSARTAGVGGDGWERGGGGGGDGGFDLVPSGWVGGLGEERDEM